MTAILLAGLLLRQRPGPARNGVESDPLFVVCAGIVAIQILAAG